MSLCLLALTSLARGGAIEAAGVRVEFAPRDRTRAEAVPALVARARTDLARTLGLSMPPLVTVRLLRMKEAFLGISDGEPVELYAGRAYPASGAIHVNMSALAREGRAIAFPRTVRHECVHLAVGHTLGKAWLAKWFEEGLACEFGSPLPGRGLAALDGRRALGLGDLARAFPRSKEAMSLAYMQSESVVRFIGRGKAKEILRRVGMGETFADALRGATGFTVEELETAWRESLAHGWAMWLARFVFAPSMLFLWTALLTVVAFFVVRRRRRAKAREMYGRFD